MHFEVGPRYGDLKLWLSSNGFKILNDTGLSNLILGKAWMTARGLFVLGRGMSSTECHSSLFLYHPFLTLCPMTLSLSPSTLKIDPDGERCLFRKRQKTQMKILRGPYCTCTSCVSQANITNSTWKCYLPGLHVAPDVALSCSWGPDL